KPQTQPKKFKPSGNKAVRQTQPTLRIIPLGGCEEVGRNMTIFEYGNDIIIIDMGLQFPEEDMPGIDYIIPNTKYLRGKEKNIKAVIFTHGHLDHIGAAQLLISRLGNPLMIGGKLTIAMIKARQEDYQKGSAKNLKTKFINSANEILRLGEFRVGFFPVSHSIIDAVGIILATPVVTVVHPGDWKFEHDPIGKKIHYKALSKLKKPTVLMLESLGVHYLKEPVSEKEMYKNIERIIARASGRIIIGTFSSMIERIKAVLEMAEKYGKKVALDGFSMKTSVELAKKLGYIKINLKNLIDIKEINNLPDNKVIVICTGAQGEENAVMARIATGEHRFIKFKKQDTVIFSSSVIPGNERTVQKLKDLIYRQSDNVIHSEIMDVHAGGHATPGDVQKIIRQINPTYFIPVYANHYMLKEAAKLARELGYNDKNIFVPDNGLVIEFGRGTARKLDQKIATDPVFVDGLGVGDVGNVVLRDRQVMSQDGMLVVIVAIDRSRNLVNKPDIISRGFVYMKNSEQLMRETKDKVSKIVNGYTKSHNMEINWSPLRARIRDEVGQFLFTKTERRPMILPVVIEV
ncbi:ribonuclease J, partial [Patescibacteria group bacterium]|nr:ribonuclease J [Patescibacteria group bacterium]